MNSDLASADGVREASQTRRDLPLSRKERDEASKVLSGDRGYD